MALDETLQNSPELGAGSPAVSSPSRLDLWGARLILAAAVAVFLSQCFWLGTARIDDAFITFAFSKNLALGHGPLYSHGLLRVEGYSNFLWMVLVALPLLVAHNLNPEVAARIMAAPFILLLGWSVYRVVGAGTKRRWIGALAVLLLAFNTDLAVAYLIGLETFAFCACTAGALATYVLSFDEPRFRRWAAWLALAAALLRIDGFLVLAFVIGCEVLRLMNRPRFFATLLRWAGPVVGIWVLWFAWRWAYYGMPLPSTYYAKALIAEAMPNRGPDYVRTELTATWLWTGLPALLWLLWRHRGAAALLGSFAILHLVYVARVGGDWMPFARFVLPSVSLLVILLVWGIADFVAWLHGHRRWMAWGAALALVAPMALVAGRTDHRFFNDNLEQDKLAGVAQQRDNVDTYVRVSPYLRQAVPADARLVTDYGGVYAYYTDASIIEMWGLANATIARRGDLERINPIYGRTCAACYPELKPEFFHVAIPLLRPANSFHSAQDVISSVWQTDTIGRYINFSADFAVGRVVRAGSDDALFFLQRRSSPYPLASRSADGFTVDYPFEPSANQAQN